jgi:hypothetical protein
MTALVLPPEMCVPRLLVRAQQAAKALAWHIPEGYADAFCVICLTDDCSSVSRVLDKGGDPAAPSGTATLLRLNPSHQFHLRRLIGDFGRPRLPWFDGRCVQGPGTYSPRHADPRLLAIPASCSRVADCNLY